MSGEPVELNKLNEKSQFMNEQKTKDENNQVTCCRSKHTKNCCIATGVFGCIFLVLGKVELHTSNYEQLTVYCYEIEYR